MLFVVLWGYEGCKWTDVLSGQDQRSYPLDSVVGEWLTLEIDERKRLGVLEVMLWLE